MSRAMIVVNGSADRDKASHWAKIAPIGTRIEWKAPKRSVDQNSLFWAILTDVASQVEHAGNKYSTEEWKLLFMHAWGREVRFLPGLDHKSVVPVGQSSSDLSKQEMTDLIEFIYTWGAEHGVKFNESVDVSSIGGQGSGAADPSTSPAAILSAAADPEAGEPEVAHGAATAPASELSAEDRTWLKLVAKMLWAATGVGEQDTLKRQMAGIRVNHTPATVNDAARAKANSINLKCKQVCFGDLGAGDVLPLIAGIAGCEVKDIVS